MLGTRMLLKSSGSMFPYWWNNTDRSIDGVILSPISSWTASTFDGTMVSALSLGSLYSGNIFKYDKYGNVVFRKLMFDIAQTYNTFNRNKILGISGNFFVTGGTSTTASGASYYQRISKIDSNGNMLAGKLISNFNISRVLSHSASKDINSTSFIYACNLTQNSIYVANMTTSLGVTWVKQLNGTGTLGEEISVVDVTTDSSLTYAYVLLNYKVSLTGYSGFKVLKFNISTGAFLSDYFYYISTGTIIPKAILWVFDGTNNNLYVNFQTAISGSTLDNIGIININTPATCSYYSMTASPYVESANNYSAMSTRVVSSAKILDITSTSGTSQRIWGFNITSQILNYNKLLSLPTGALSGASIRYPATTNTDITAIGYNTNTDGIFLTNITTSTPENISYGGLTITADSTTLSGPNTLISTSTSYVMTSVTPTVTWTDDTITTTIDSYVYASTTKPIGDV